MTKTITMQKITGQARTCDQCLVALLDAICRGCHLNCGKKFLCQEKFQSVLSVTSNRGHSHSSSNRGHSHRSSKRGHSHRSSKRGLPSEELKKRTPLRGAQREDTLIWAQREDSHMCSKRGLLSEEANKILSVSVIRHVFITKIMIRDFKIDCCDKRAIHRNLPRAVSFCRETICSPQNRSWPERFWHLSKIYNFALPGPVMSRPFLYPKYITLPSFVTSGPLPNNRCWPGTPEMGDAKTCNAQCLCVCNAQHNAQCTSYTLCRIHTCISYIYFIGPCIC